MEDPPLASAVFGWQPEGMDGRNLRVDLGTNSCRVVGPDSAGHVVLHRLIRAENIVVLAAKLLGRQVCPTKSNC